MFLHVAAMVGWSLTTPVQSATPFDTSVHSVPTPPAQVPFGVYLGWTSHLVYIKYFVQAGMTKVLTNVRVV